MSEIIVDNARTGALFPVELTCERCKSVIKVELSDLTYDGWKVGGYWFAGTEIIEQHFSWECPACRHASNFVDATHIPIGVQDDLKADYQARKAANPSII